MPGGLVSTVRSRGETNPIKTITPSPSRRREGKGQGDGFPNIVQSAVFLAKSGFVHTGYPICDFGGFIGIVNLDFLFYRLHIDYAIAVN